MKRQMTIGKRISVGFTIVIAIAMILGGMAVYSMKAVQTDSNKLASEYVPEVKITTDLRGAANRLMYQMRGYGMTEDDKYYQAAIAELGAVNKHIQEAQDLADRAIYLKALDGQVATARDAANTYAGLIQQTEETIGRMAKERTVLDQSAADFMHNCTEFLEGQNQAFRKDLNERQSKIAVVTDIVDLGTAVRVMNFKAQANGDTDLLEHAIRRLDGLKIHTNKLRPITRKQENITQIEEIESAALAYGRAMQGSLDELEKGAYADASALREHTSAMDEAAGRYVANCEAFLESQQTQLTKDMMERNQKITLVNDVIDLGNDSRVKAFKSQALRSPTLMEQAVANFAKLDAKYEDLRKITRLEIDLERIDKTQESGANYAHALETFLADWKNLQHLGTQRETAAKDLIEACKVAANAGMDNTDLIANEAASSLSRSSTIMVIGLAIGLLFAIACSVWITRTLNSVLGRISEGLDAGAEQVASASAQVSSASQSLAEGSSEQAASLEETSSSLEEMASMTRQNADNANQADTLMRDANQVVKLANHSMGDLTSSMDEISKASEETSKIIKTIDEIAFQTNLLALNAAVEAARAGEAGAGFAVVADEVRNLAMRAAEAAKDTANLIETTVKKVNDGGELVSKTNEAFGQVADNARKVGDLVGEISAASNEQAQGIEQVNRAVTEMDKVTQQNAANAEESASASEEMNAQAEVMKTSVSELLALVGGSSNGNGTGFMPKGARMLTSGQQTKKNSQIQGGGSKQAIVPKPQEVNPAQVIPFENDEDFKDF